MPSNKFINSYVDIMRQLRLLEAMKRRGNLYAAQMLIERDAESGHSQQMILRGLMKDDLGLTLMGIEKSRENGFETNISMHQQIDLWEYVERYDLHWIADSEVAA